MWQASGIRNSLTATTPAAKFDSPPFVLDAALKTNVVEGLIPGFRCTLTEWPLLAKPPFAAGPMDDSRADKRDLRSPS